jgi:hypothetical protein
MQGGGMREASLRSASLIPPPSSKSHFVPRNNNLPDGSILDAHGGSKFNAD